MKQEWKSSSEKFISYGKYKDLFDRKSIECWLSVAIAFVLSILSGVICNCNKTGQIEYINNIVPIAVDIAIALIGFLGFIVAGLAIMTGLVSNKVLGRLKEHDKLKNLEKVLLSFYLLGIVCAVFVFGAFLAEYISQLPMQPIIWATVLLTWLLTYLLIFTVIYSVKLIGDCIDLFLIINQMEEEEDNG